MPKISVQGKQFDGYQPLPKGTYDFTITAIDETVSKNQNPQLKLSAQVNDGPHQSKKCTIWYALTEKSVWKLAQLCEACEVGEVVELDTIDPETGKPNLQVDVDTEELVGCIFRADVEVEDYQGKPQNRYNNERPVSGQAKPAASNGSKSQPASQPAAQPGVATAGAMQAQAAAAATAQPAQRRRRAV